MPIIPRLTPARLRGYKSSGFTNRTRAGEQTWLGLLSRMLKPAISNGRGQDRPFATALAGPEGLKTFRTASPALVKTYQASPPIGVCEGEFSSLGI